jgi:glycosyltransferase involved in cell wall biosynthesis
LKVSILVPTFNRSCLLKDCLKSILNQTYKNFEIIIINDASTDDTEIVVEKINDPRIKYYKNKKNQGSLYGDRIHFKRFYSEIMSGELFCYLPDDDLWLFEDHLEKAVELFRQDSDLSIVIGSQLSQFYDKDEDLKPLTKNEVLDKINNKDNKFYYFNLLPEGHYSSSEYLNYFSQQATHFNICISGIVFKKEKLSKFDYLNSKTPSKWQGGYEYLIPPMLCGNIYFVNRPSALVRVSPNNASFQLTQYDHYYDSLVSVNNAFLIDKNLTNLDIVYYKKKFFQSLTFAYLQNSINIMKFKKLTMNSKNNIERYVNVGDIIKFMMKFKFIIDLRTFFSISIYLRYKLVNKLYG